MLGCFTRIQIELKKVHSGLLKVTALVNRNLAEAFQIFEERLPGSDYLVGWVDCFAKGDALGRGEIHQANYLASGEDPNPNQTLRVAKQELPDTFLFGLLPKAILWRVMKMLWHDPGLKFTNWAKYVVGKRHHGAKYLQSHAGFAFLLDYVPNWKKAYGTGGLIQYQSFVPRDKAQEVFRKQIELQHQYGLVSYLGVMKRHRPDDFWMTHAVDGYSMALDFRVTEDNRKRLWKLAAEMNKLVVDAGGRFYYAKDLTLSPDILKGYMQEERVQKFLKLKQEVDPDEMLQTELWRRLFAAKD
jgi:hypothetical protein